MMNVMRLFLFKLTYFATHEDNIHSKLCLLVTILFLMRMIYNLILRTIYFKFSFETEYAYLFHLTYTSFHLTHNLASSSSFLN